MKKILVVGQGLAGTFLSFELMKRGVEVIIIDQPCSISASYISAGVFNPIVLKRFTPVWQGIEQVLFLIGKIRELELFLNAKFLINKPVYRIFHSRDEYHTWQRKRILLGEYLGEIETLPNVINPHQAGKVLNSGRFCVSDLLKNFRAFALKHNFLIEESFNFANFRYSNKSIAYKNLVLDAVIFCQGALVKTNPFFDFLPIKKNKGERLLVRMKNFELQNTVKKKHFFFQHFEEVFYVGGTHSHWDQSEHVTRQKRNELESALREISPHSYTIVAHDFAFRPVTLDRRAVLGEHPKYKNLWVFNGLGTRGAMVGAYYASVLADVILYQKAIPPEVNITRFL